MDIDTIMNKRFEMAMGNSETTMRKTELDKYLGEDRELMDSHFDILKWWKVQRCRYRGRVLDTFRTSLTSKMVKALVCSQDWFRASHTPVMIDDMLLEIEKLEEDFKDLCSVHPSIIIDETIDESDCFLVLTAFKVGCCFWFACAVSVAVLRLYASDS